MDKTEVYLGLGGNIGDTQAVFAQALRRIAALPDVSNMRLSRIYRTKPWRALPQRAYLNAVCRLRTTQPLHLLLSELQAIEEALGKLPKPKDCPRILDIDLLLYGETLSESPECRVPHPHWRERLFVLAPLSDLVRSLRVPKAGGEIECVDISQLLRAFSPIPSAEARPIACRPELRIFQSTGRK